MKSTYWLLKWRSKMAAYWLPTWRNPRWWSRDWVHRAGSPESKMAVGALQPIGACTPAYSNERETILPQRGATVAERLARSPPTKAKRAQSPAGSPDFRKWESCRTMPLVGGFSQRSPVSLAPSFRRRSIFTSITLIGSQDLAVKSRPNIFTHASETQNKESSDHQMSHRCYAHSTEPEKREKNQPPMEESVVATWGTMGEDADRSVSKMVASVYGMDDLSKRVTCLEPAVTASTSCWIRAPTAGFRTTAISVSITRLLTAECPPRKSSSSKMMCCHSILLSSFKCISSASVKSLGSPVHNANTHANRARIPVDALLDFRMWESCRTMPQAGRFSSEISRFPCTCIRRCSILTSLRPLKTSLLRAVQIFQLNSTYSTEKKFLET
ncbi:hypothetical protein PR048_024783 [Dryococelus australis]|uniref:Uncharacterized protein n=1 Tax=Dryococelus australis TaxID=614101 RepID=A0ABQ9GPL9_9NEOP|nr:hypothetical protein PR048_024783 [Dryococelus australis]